MVNTLFRTVIIAEYYPVILNESYFYAVFLVFRK